MRQGKSSWVRFWTRTWLRKFTAISVCTAITTASLGNVLTASPKKTGKPKAAERAEKAAERAAERAAEKQPQDKPDSKSTVPAKPGEKSPSPSTPPVEKVARKTDDNRVDAPTRSLPQELAANHPLAPAVKAAEASLKAAMALKDYSTTLYKQERIGDKLIQQTLLTKIRHEPFSVYMKFQNPYAGREVIFVEGLNKGKFLVHETGFKSLAGTLSFLPSSKEALAENRYPITQAGMVNMVKTVIDIWKSEGKYHEVQIRTIVETKLGEQVCTVIEVVHPKQRDYFKFHKTRLYIEDSTKLPIRLEQFGWPATEGGEPVLMEEYTHMEVKPNLGMTDLDFDKKNPAYDF